jgi:FkbM family methyltransferase
MNLTEYEQMQPNVNVDGIIFLTPNTHCAWRAESLYTKEPDTIAWLRKMKPEEVLFDIGANMGQYSMFAAKLSVIVHAFEPESQNFALLCRNIAINKLNDLIKPWPMALSDEPSLDLFYVQSMMPGGSCSSYGQSVNFHLQPRQFAFHQGSIAVTMDDFSDRYGFPDHIKIDVDGFEHKVIFGSGACLTQVKSVLVELNTKLVEHMKIYEIMEDHGLYPDVETAEIARRKEGAFKDIGNVIFYRK